MYKINRRGCIKDDNMEVVIVVIKEECWEWGIVINVDE